MVTAPGAQSAYGYRRRLRSTGPPSETTMRLEQLARQTGARVYTHGRDVDIELDQVYAGDRVSDLLNAAGDHALLVTNLASTHLVRLAELMDVPAICLVNNQTPDESMLTTARQHGTWLLVSPHDLFVTCGRLYASLAGGHPA